MSKRQEQVESLLHRAVAEVLQRGLADPRIKGMVSVTRVETSPDLRHAHVYVSVLPEQYESRTIHGLRDATMHLQSEVKKRVALRLVPHLDFRLDETLKKQADVFAAINEGLERSGLPPAEDDDAADDTFTPDQPDAEASAAEDAVGETPRDP